MLRLLPLIESLSDTRHDYVHGAALEYAIDKSILSVTMGRLLQPTKKPRRRTIRVTTSSLARCTNQLQAISDQLLDLAECRAICVHHFYAFRALKLRANQRTMPNTIPPMIHKSAMGNNNAAQATKPSL